MGAKPVNYCSYLLRCWVEPSNRKSEVAYRFSLEDPHTGDRHTLAGLDSLVEFLRAQLPASEGRATSDN